MPTAALKPCANRLCPELVPKGTTYCAKHRAADYKRKDAERPNKAQRKLYSSARWRKLRRIVLNRDVWCRVCKRQPSTEVDHIERVATGGDFWSLDNLQGLCARCHGQKTVAETFGGGEALHRPRIKPSAVPVVMVSGPPCSGKTTWVRLHAALGDLVIDVDEIRKEQGGTMQKALAERNRILAGLHREAGRQAWFIVTAAQSAVRRWWAAQLGNVRRVVIEVPAEECKRRARQAGRPSSTDEVIDRWWATYSGDYQDTVIVDSLARHPDFAG